MLPKQTSTAGSLLQGSSARQVQSTAPSPQQTVTPAINQQPVSSVVDMVNSNTAPTDTNNTQTQSYVDPYAQFGGADNYNRLVSGFDTQKSAIFDTANDATATSAGRLRNTILDLVDAMRAGQTVLDNRGINNELSLMRGANDVNGMVSNGIRSGGVMLANNNAADSSAAEGIARAYGEIGRRQMSDIGNQYQLEKTDIGLAQEDLDRQMTAGIRSIETDQDEAMMNIVSDAQNKLAALDAAMANASLPERIAVDAEKNKIRQQVLAKMSQLDKLLTSRMSEINPMSRDQRMTEATTRNTLGAAPEAQFDYSTEVPTQFQNTGPFASELPIFTYNKSKQNY